YGMSAQTKAFFDRSFSYYSNAYPDAEQVHQRMSGKRIGLTVASEETYPDEFAMRVAAEFLNLMHDPHCPAGVSFFR
ncbi:NAD(P)H-dependent oxidoreductase, partial [[Eubacterium] rectale]|nr:NAD(P)H-dependent oxidoreductase [Agathobacter rectalis]